MEVRILYMGLIDGYFSEGGICIYILLVCFVVDMDGVGWIGD